MVGYLAAIKGTTSVTSKTVDKVRQLSTAKNSPPTVAIKDIYRIESDGSKTGMAWGEGVYKQGYPFEDFVGIVRKFSPAERLPNSFDVFDYFSKTKEAISVKTLDTGAKTYQKSTKISAQLNKYIDNVYNYKDTTKSGFTLNSKDIKIKTIELAIPDKTTSAQWVEINKSLIYATGKNIDLKITVVKTEVK